MNRCANEKSRENNEHRKAFFPLSLVSFEISLLEKRKETFMGPMNRKQRKTIRQFLSEAGGCLLDKLLGHRLFGALILAIAPFLIAAPVQARDYRGVQAVLFMAWDDASVEKFIQTVAAARTSLPANRFELAVLYMTERLPRHDDQSPRTRWDNIRRVIDCLATVPQPPQAHCPAVLPAAIDLKVRVFFGLHNFDGKAEADDLKILRSRAAEFNTQLLKNYGNRIVFRLSPLLEEQPAISYEKFAQAIFDQLDGSMVCSSIYPRLIRSGGSSPASVTVRVKCKPTDTRLTSRSISVSLESHGKSPRSGFDSWSNDGYFV